MYKNYWSSQWKYNHCEDCIKKPMGDNTDCINEHGVIIHSGYMCDETCPYY